MEVQIKLRPEEYENRDLWKKAVASKLALKPQQIRGLQLLRRSIDARKKPLFVLKLKVFTEEEMPEAHNPTFPLQDVSNAPEVHIVGLGSAGLFAALELIKQGFKPILIERGKKVRDRRRDLATLTREGVVNPDSNYCFGEGGAGTFSDGKLYTRSKKRGDVQQVLEILVQFGAVEDILIDAHPHIGTNKLPKIIENIREAILETGGEIHFDTKMTSLKKTDKQITAIELNGDSWMQVKSLILATGHSARDIFELLHRKKIRIDAKPFALGVRVEHPQALIDKIQYHSSDPRHVCLPAASYSLVHQVNQKGIYSFCMCPGGIICPAATANDEVVVNGWSPSKRNSPYANSGIVVEIGLQDMIDPLENPLAGIAYQQAVEQRAFQLGGGKQVAPAQRLYDFVNGKTSNSLPDSSYLPGTQSINLKEVLPPHVMHGLQQGFRTFGKKMKGYLTNEAIVVGTESRTSSPIRIPRDRESLMHPEVDGFFPCGEGAGYAGGIMSAAIDGQRCALAVMRYLKEEKGA
jgi:uncharacterized FAD-dependent dehydrogenase